MAGNKAYSIITEDEFSDYEKSDLTGIHLHLIFESCRANVYSGIK